MAQEVKYIFIGKNTTMKKSIVILLFFIALGAKAQGNLQFNQVKLVTTIETVPVGKVWKVESASYNGGSAINIGQIQTANSAGTYTVSSFIVFKINGQNNYLPVVGLSGVSALNSFPIWIPSGTTLEASTNTNFLSVIEFNITQ